MREARPQAQSGKVRVGGPIRSGNLIFVGGIGGWYPDKRPDGPGDVRQQFTDALESMKASLEKAGTSMANVLQVSVPLVDPEKNWSGLLDVFNQQFPEPRPALICFGAAGYRRAGQLLQVECICHVD